MSAKASNPISLTLSGMSISSLLQQINASLSIRRIPSGIVILYLTFSSEQIDSTSSCVITSEFEDKQIENIEAGNIDAFKDIFYLKYFIRDYSKYLGLDYEDMIDEFNEYLFDYTSKISLNDIKKAKKQIENKKQEKKIASPYTLEKKNRIYYIRY